MNSPSNMYLCLFSAAADMLEDILTKQIYWNCSKNNAQEKKKKNLTMVYNVKKEVIFNLCSSNIVNKINILCNQAIIAQTTCQH